MTLATLLLLGVFVAVLVAVVVWWRGSDATKSANADAGLLTATEWLDDETQRTLRAQLRDMHELGTNVPANEVYVVAAERVGRVCQTIGYYVKNRFVPGDPVMANWGREIVSAWHACKPWADYRREDEDPSVWADFEWLANECLAKHQRPPGEARG